MEYLYRLRCGKYGYNWFNLGLNSRNKCPSICCASFTSLEDLEIEISPIVVPYRSTTPPFFVDGNCVDGNWLPTVEWGADQTTLLKLYRSLVRSKLDYGCIVYGSASKTALAKLDPVHNQGLRLSLGAFRSSPVESLYVEAHEPPLEIRREKLALQYILKLKANLGNPAYDVVFIPKYQILYADKESASDSFGIHCKKLLKKAKIDIGRLRLKSPASRLFDQPLVQAQIKENIKAPRHWPLSGESTGDRWIPLTKDH